MTPAELAAIRERANNATEGPWAVTESCEETEFGLSEIYGIKDVCDVDWASDSAPAFHYTEGFWKADAVFIAHARTDIPALLDHVDQLERQRDQARAEVVYEIERKSALQARIDQALKLHTPVTDTDGSQWCQTCLNPLGEHVPYPCPTMKALTGH